MRVRLPFFWTAYLPSPIPLSKYFNTQDGECRSTVVNSSFTQKVNNNDVCTHRELNPDFMRWQAHGGLQTYAVAIPISAKHKPCCWGGCGSEQVRAQWWRPCADPIDRNTYAIYRCHSGPGPHSWSSGHQQLGAAIQLPPISPQLVLSVGDYL